MLDMPVAGLVQDGVIAAVVGGAQMYRAHPVKSALPGDRHGGFGERSGETDRERSRYRARGLLSDLRGSKGWEGCILGSS
ncbi:hypothetical protein GCM10017559_45550 [Streptosporangium longisporum]|uniref:Uncharacterized protein n=1 Tax=Streptosporangium longisporum TaxID=46187 RepID=A0ABN3Y3E5_9ACTN